MSPARVVELLEAIDGLPTNASGALVFQGDDGRGGAILVEDGRVCWAVAGGMQRRLTDLIAANLPDGMTRQDLSSIFRASKESKRPLGELLVEKGILERDHFRRILRQHTAEAIGMIGARAPAARRWQSHSRNRYDAEFTFSPAELLASAGALADPDLALLGEETLAGASLEGAAVAYARLEGFADLFPIAEVRGTELGVQSIADLGRWAAGALDLSDAFTQGTRVVMAARPDGQSIVAWRDRGIVVAIVCEDRSTAAWAVARQNRKAETGKHASPPAEEPR